VIMRRAFVLAGVLLGACGEGGGETGVDLAIRWDAALGLDRLALSVSAGGEKLVERSLLPEEARPLSASGREAVVVLLPDRLGGDEVSLEVDGLARAEVVATGRVAVTLSPGELVTAAIALRPVGEQGCEDWDTAPSNLVPCEAPAPEGALILDRPGTYVIDTATGQIATPDGDSLEPASDLAPQVGGPMVRRISVDSLVVDDGTEVVASGPHALLIAVWGDATIDGTIDLAGESGRDGPGGGDGDLCATAGGSSGGEAGEAGSGAGGGGGGARSGDGGDGGDGHGDEKGSKGAKGRAAGGADLVPLTGGCRGGGGGDAYGAPGSGAAGGGAGGAFEIAAQGGIALSGTIRVAGGGGGGGAAAATSGAGGGGGGSGGAILLEAMEIELSGVARLCANGGSGGEGGLASEAGSGGSPGTCTGERAVTSNQTDGGGDGGRGGAGDARAGENAKAGSGSGAGGGGGGGTGRIRLRALGQLTDHGALLTPEAE